MRASPRCGVSSVARMRIVVVLPAPLGPMNPRTCAALDAERHVVHGAHAVEVPDEPVELQHRVAHGWPSGPAEHEVEAASLDDARHAGLPERRAFEDREIRAGWLILDEVHESRRQRQVGGHHIRALARAPVFRVALPPGGSGPARRVHRVAIAIDERRDRRTESVHDGHPAGLAAEAQSLAGGPEADLLEVGRRPRLDQLPRRSAARR